MKIVMKVKDLKVLKEAWEGWIEEEEEIINEIKEQGGSAINEPTIHKDGNKYFYNTCTNKGFYEFDGKLLIFDGVRNSFGNTNYFDIVRKNGELLIPGVTELEALQYDTSLPEKPFWAVKTKEQIDDWEEKHTFNYGKTLNLTQHDATEEQKKEGVVEPPDKKRIQELLTFEDLPSQLEILKRAEKLTMIPLKEGFDVVMVGGVPFLMGTLEEALMKKHIRPIYAFSKRESIDEKMPDGTIKKTQKFRHLGFVWVPDVR